MATKLVEHAEAIVAAYVLQGKSLREIADNYGVSSGSVRSVLKKNGAVLRSRGRKAGKVVVDDGAGNVMPIVPDSVFNVEGV